MATYQAMLDMNNALIRYIYSGLGPVAVRDDLAESTFTEGTLVLALKWVEDDIEVLLHRCTVYQQPQQLDAIERVEQDWQAQSVLMNREFNRVPGPHGFMAMEARALQAYQDMGLTKAGVAELLWKRVVTRQALLSNNQYIDLAFRDALHRTKGEGLPFL